MKKIEYICILSLLCLIIGGCSHKSKKVWTIEDFSVYDEKGEICNYPSNQEFTFYDNADGLQSFYDENGGEENLKYQTKRGVKIHSSAKMVFSKYDLNGFYMALTRWPILGSNDDDDNKIQEDYFKMYPSVNEAVKHTSEIENDLALYISGQFQLNENGRMTLLQLNELGNPVNQDSSKDTYKLVFYIRDDNVFQWETSHKSAKK